MTFRRATDVILGIIDLRDVAKALGVSHQLILKARLTTKSRKNPPAGWEPVVRDLARKKAAELREQATRLEALAEELDAEIASAPAGPVTHPDPSSPPASPA